VVDQPQFEIPPWPWPDQDDAHPWRGCPPGGDWCLGDVGTVWTFKQSDLDGRLVGLGVDTSLYEIAGDYISKAIEIMSRWTNVGQTCDKLDDDDDPHIAWVSGLSRPEEPVVPNYPVVRAVVHAKLGTLEELAHVLHFRLHTGAATMPNLADLVTFGGHIATAWQQFFAAQSAGSPVVHPNFSQQLVYDEVRMSVVEYQQAATPMPRPNPLFTIPTQYIAMPANVQGSGSTATTLPYEVALCLTHLTNARGRSNKGRIYLGGLSTAILSSSAPGGIFEAGKVQAIALAYWNMLAGLSGATPGYDLQVMSARSHVGNAGPKHPGGEGPWAAPSSKGVQGIRVGVVPDSQRRRRRSELELYTVSGGTAP
jgi:hypothetical protein